MVSRGGWHPGPAPVSTPSLCLPIPRAPQPLLQTGGVCPCPHPATGLLPSLSYSQIPPQSRPHSLPLCTQPDHLPDIIPPPPASGVGGAGVLLVLSGCGAWTPLSFVPCLQSEQESSWRPWRTPSDSRNLGRCPSSFGLFLFKVKVV